MTIVFENTDTMRCQVQEMARAERMLRDEQIAHEVETYNELIPDDGRALGARCSSSSPTPALREWLPKLVGIELHIAIEVAGDVVPAVEVDEERLTREDEITSAVHYLRFPFTDASVDGSRRPGARSWSTIPHYRPGRAHRRATRELLGDFADSVPAARLARICA